MTHETLIQLVQEAAVARGEPRLHERFIKLALTRIERGEEAVEQYPTGRPSLKGVYDIASRLQKKGPLTRLEHDSDIDDVMEKLTGPLHHH